MRRSEHEARETVPTSEMVLEALRTGVQRALRIHKALGNPIATFENGKIVLVPPEQIELQEPAPPLFGERTAE